MSWPLSPDPVVKVRPIRGDQLSLCQHDRSIFCSRSTFNSTALWIAFESLCWSIENMIIVPASSIAPNRTEFVWAKLISQTGAAKPFRRTRVAVFRVDHFDLPEKLGFNFWRIENSEHIYGICSLKSKLLFYFICFVRILNFPEVIKFLISRTKWSTLGSVSIEHTDGIWLASNNIGNETRRNRY